MRAFFDRFSVTSNQPGINNRCAVWSAIILATWRVVIVAAFLFERCVIGDHRIDAASRHAPEKFGFAEPADVHERIGAGLGDDPDAVSRIREDFANHRGPHEGAVYIAVAADDDDIERIPAKGIHFFACGR